MLVANGELPKKHDKIATALKYIHIAYWAWGISIAATCV